MGDTQISELLAAAMLAVVVYCVARLVLSLRAGGVTQRDSDVVHAAMGISMAGMLVPSLTSVPNGAWIAIFSGSALWFGWKVLRDAERTSIGSHALGSHMTHLLMCAAMVYMLVVMDWTGSMHTAHAAGMLAMNRASMSGTPWPIFAVVLTVLLVGDAAISAGFRLRGLASMAPASVGELAVRRAVDATYALAVADGRAASHSSHEPSGTHDGPPPSSNLLAPRSALICQLVMCLVMGYMLVTLS